MIASIASRLVIDCDGQKRFMVEIVLDPGRSEKVVLKKSSTTFLDFDSRSAWQKPGSFSGGLFKSWY